jgi:hypothetical protein
MIADWKQEIAIAWLVKQAMMDLDKENIFPYHMPELAASEENISNAERMLGHELDSRFKEFLHHANGWQAFWHAADLFGTADLIGGRRKETGQFLLKMIPDGVLCNSGIRRNDLLPISATKLDKDLFVITRPSSRYPGTVIWFAGEEVERYASFDEYFLAMVNFSRKDVEWLRRRKSAI